MAEEDITSALIGGDSKTELASNRTALAFERTRLAADRTLMAVIRTGLSLIGFGFTIFQFLRHVVEWTHAGTAHSSVTLAEARNFGLSLVLLGVFMVVAGLFTHSVALKRLTGRRDRLIGLQLMRPGEDYQTSPTVVTAVLLLFIGILAVVGMLLQAGPFG